MRVLFVDQFSQLGGAQLMLRDVLAEGRRRGWHCEVILPGQGGLVDYCRDAGVRVHSLPIGRYTNTVKKWWEVLRYGFDMAQAAKAIRSIVSRQKIDLVVVNGPRILAATVGVSCPVVFHVHSRPDKLYTSLILRWSLRQTGATVICCSRFVAGILARDPARIVYNGVADCGFAGERTRSLTPTVAIIGRVAPEKGHLDFVRAAEIVTRSNPHARFAVHGAALFSDPSFETQLRAVKTSVKVDFLGWTDDVASALHGADVLVVPSSSVDATPRVIIEAFSAGTPVIAYPWGGMPELIRHEETGLLTSRPHYESLAEAINRLLQDRLLAARLARNARAEWERRFRLEQFQSEVCGLLERCAEQRGKAQAPSTVACENNLA